jgi:hypothetical protein
MIVLTRAQRAMTNTLESIDYGTDGSGGIFASQ